MDFFGFHPLYVVILLAIALIIFGPSRLPKMGAQMGRMLREFQAAREGLTQQMREAFEEEPNFGSSSGPTVAVVNQEPASDTAASTETAVGVADRPLGETVASEILDRPAGESTVGEAMPGEPEGTGAVAAEAAPGASTPEIDLSTVAAAKSPLPEVTSDEGQAAAAATVEPQGDGATPEDGSTPAASGLTVERDGARGSGGAAGDPRGTSGDGGRGAGGLRRGAGAPCTGRGSRGFGHRWRCGRLGRRRTRARCRPGPNSAITTRA